MRSVTLGLDAESDFRDLPSCLRGLDRSTEVFVRPGTYEMGEGASANGLVDVSFRGTDPTSPPVFKPSPSLTGKVPGLKLAKCDNILFENIWFTDWPLQGLFIVQSINVIIEKCRFLRNGKSGLLTGNSSKVQVKHSTSSNNGEHGIYFSQSGDLLTAYGCDLDFNVAAGIQINAAEGRKTGDPMYDWRSDRCLIEKCRIRNNGAQGGSAINLMGVCVSVIKDNLLEWNKAGGVALWDDELKAHCRNNTILSNVIRFYKTEGRFGIQVKKGSKHNRAESNAIYIDANAFDLEEKVARQSNNTVFPGIKR